VGAEGVREDRGVSIPGAARPSGDWRDLAAGVRLLASDLDGTLVRHDGSVSAYTRETLTAARDSGVPVVFVTGRPPRWMPPVVESTGHTGVAICANGGLLLDLATMQVLDAHGIPQPVLEEVVTTLRSEVPGIAFALEWAPGTGTAPDEHFGHEHAYVPRYPVGAPPTAADVRALAEGRTVVKLLARVALGGHDADSFLEHALAHVEHLVTVTHSDSADVLLEMSALGVSKGSELARYAAGLGLGPAACAAVGDMPNDVPMLSWAGAGLAVEGAHPRVLEAADGVLPGPEEDGVARFLAAVLGTPQPEGRPAG